MAFQRLPISCDRDCGGGCPLTAHVHNGRVVKITDAPTGDGHFRGCLKGYRLCDTTYAPDRIRTPLLRTGARGSGGFQAVSWSTALDWVAARLDTLKHQYGSLSVLPHSGSGSCRAAVHNTSRLARRFFSGLGGFVDRCDSYSSAAADYTALGLFGTPWVGIDPDTLDQSKLIVLWGANICSARLFSSRLESIIAKARTNGTRVVVIDPRRSRTADRLADQWIPIRPGTDSAMMAAMLYVINSEGLLDSAFVARTTSGFDALIDSITGTTDGCPQNPRWAERICGVPAETIYELARRYGTAKPAALLPGLSIQRVVGGEENYRFATALQAATGNIGVDGGSSGGAAGKLPGPEFPAIPVPDLTQMPTIPVYRWADMVLQGQKGGYPADIKAIYSVGANFLNQGSDIAKNRRAFLSVDLVVTHDLFMTPTARFSDAILPATTSLEREDVIFGGDNCLFYSSQAIEPLEGTRHDYDILGALADRLGFAQAFSQGRSANQWLALLMSRSEIDDIDHFKRTGVYMGRDQRRVGLRAFVENPHRAPLNTPSGKIEIRSTAFARDGAAAIPTVRNRKIDRRYPLTLITPHARFRINSQNSNLKWARRLLKRRIWMNADDAARRGLRTGDRVRVESRQGAMEIDVTLDAHIAAGCVVLFQGDWTACDAQGVETGGSANTLTSSTPTLPSQGSRTHSTDVEVTAAG
jgi:anaerobic dimethyl sulfoxide reductase subunit A